MVPILTSVTRSPVFIYDLVRLDKDASELYTVFDFVFDYCRVIKRLRFKDV